MAPTPMQLIDDSTRHDAEYAAALPARRWMGKRRRRLATLAGLALFLPDMGHASDVAAPESADRPLVVATHAAGTVTCDALRRAATAGRDTVRLAKRLGLQAILAARVAEDSALDRDGQIMERRRLAAALRASLADGIEITPAAVRRHYQENRDQFARPAMISTRLLLLRLAADADQAEHAARRVEIETIRQAFTAGRPFAELAREFSEAENASRGGAVAPAARGTLLEAYETVAWALDPGAVSEPVRLPDGLALILHERTHPAVARALTEVETKIEKRLRRQEVAARTQQILATVEKAHPTTIDWDHLARHGYAVDEPFVRTGSERSSLQSLGLAHRPPLLEQAVTREVEHLRLARFARQQPQFATLRQQLETQRQTMRATAALDALLDQRTTTAAAGGRPLEVAVRTFEAVLIPIEDGRKRPALAAATSLDPRRSPQRRPWGPLSQEALAQATSPRLAAKLFTQQGNEFGPATLIESYDVGRIRFEPRAYARIRLVAEGTQTRPPSPRQRRTRLARHAETVAAIEASLLRDAAFVLDRQALDQCLAGVTAPDDRAGGAPRPPADR